MSRYFKQIAKSVRANGSASSGSEENADDFLGCINVPLNVSVQTNDHPPLLRLPCGCPCDLLFAGDAGGRLRLLVQAGASVEHV